MRLERIKAFVQGVPYTSPADGQLLYEHVLETEPRVCLELGFAHGVGSLYVAGALDELGRGQLHAVDLLAERERRVPSIENLLQRSGLAHCVEVFREATSYTWFLKKQIERQTKDNRCQPLYDFCFIDGAKNWTIDGMAFFCVDKLLMEHGWILFDDMEWYYENYDKPVMDGITIRELSEEERMTPQIKAVFELIVLQHPSYSNFVVMDNGWGWAQKVKSHVGTVRYESTVSTKYALHKLARSILPARYLSRRWRRTG